MKGMAAATGNVDCIRYTVKKGIPYLGPDRKEQMDIYLPDCPERETLPCVIIVTGESWAAGKRGGDREARTAVKLAAEGYAAVVADIAAASYRGPSWNPELAIPGWPTNLNDCKAAVRYARKHAASYRINPDKIAIMGGSTGGHVALLAALTADCEEAGQRGGLAQYSAGVQCLINLYGIADILSWEESSFAAVPYRSYSQCSGEREQAAQACSSESAVAGLAPILIAHSGVSEGGAIAISAAFADEAMSIAAVRQYAAVERSYSAGCDAFRRQCIDLRSVIVDFLDRYLK